MEDDDDLEVLRLMALKTLHKKENAPTQPPQQQQVAHQPKNSIMVNHTIPVLSNVRHPMDNNYYPTMDPVQTNIIHHPVPSFVNSGFEKMDINEPYVPQRIHPTSVDPFIGFPNYIPSSTTTTTTAIGQLSPRTAAFVLANKETIERRRIISPEPYRKPSGRWSRSPSCESWKYRRSGSRSPSYHNNHSPNMHNRSVTPPPRRRHSPTALHNRKSRSRSPNSRNQHENNHHRAEKRSPKRNRGNAPPYNNRNERKFRGHETHRVDTAVRKSNSPRTDDSNHRTKRRTQSPLNSKPDVKKRSPSRSPNRKYPRNNTSNLRRSRRSPPQPGKRFNSNNNSRQNNTNVRNRNYNTRRSTSPSMNRRNDSRTPPNQQKRTTSTKNEDESTQKLAENESKSERIEDNKMNEDETSNKISETETTANVPRQKTQQEIEDELLASERDDNSDSDDDDDDGIDLFASEDSESENEGRFKLSSSKSERKTNVATVSFSELGKPAAPSADVLRDLDEVQTDAGPSHRKGNPRRENGRDTRAGNSRHHGRRYNEKRSYPDRDRDRGERGTRERENRDSNKSAGSNSRKKDVVDTDQPGVRRERKLNMLKSTVDSIESESRRKTPEAGMIKIRFFTYTLGTILTNYNFNLLAKNSEAKEKDGEEIKRGAITLKRSIKNTERGKLKQQGERKDTIPKYNIRMVAPFSDAGIRNLQSTISGPTMNEKQRSSPTGDTGNGTTGKKPIHSRLGAMTSTWKSNKKSWKSEKVFFIKV